MTDSFKVDLEQLKNLSTTVEDLGRKVGAIRCDKGAVEAFNTGKPGGVMTERSVPSRISNCRVIPYRS
ncbi:hypothetical protein [Nocardia sp. NPDC004722]